MRFTKTCLRFSKTVFRFSKTAVRFTSGFSKVLVSLTRRVWQGLRKILISLPRGARLGYSNRFSKPGVLARPGGRVRRVPEPPLRLGRLANELASASHDAREAGA